VPPTAAPGERLSPELILVCPELRSEALAWAGPAPVIVRPQALVQAPQLAVVHGERHDGTLEVARPSRRRRLSIRDSAVAALVPLALGVSFSVVQKHWRTKPAAALAPVASPRQPPVNVTQPSEAASHLTLPRAAAPRARFFNDVVAVSVVSHSGQATLRWTPPRQFDHVAILRRPGARGSRRSEVYSGRATSFIDRAVRQGIDYRYLLVAYDRRGRRSRGVALCLQGPTSRWSRACSSAET